MQVSTGSPVEVAAGGRSGAAPIGDVSLRSLTTAGPMSAIGWVTDGVGRMSYFKGLHLRHRPEPRITAIFAANGARMEA
jgi:hypothetical protein